MKYLFIGINQLFQVAHKNKTPYNSGRANTQTMELVVHLRTYVNIDYFFFLSKMITAPSILGVIHKSRHTNFMIFYPSPSLSQVVTFLRHPPT